MTRLRSLYLTAIEITDAGLVHLKGLANLKWLNLAVTQVTDAGLVHLKGLTKLEGLNLARTQVTYTSVEHAFRLQSTFESPDSVTHCDSPHQRWRRQG